MVGGFNKTPCKYNKIGQISETKWLNQTELNFNSNCHHFCRNWLGSILVLVEACDCDCLKCILETVLNRSLFQTITCYIRL